MSAFPQFHGHGHFTPAFYPAYPAFQSHCFPPVSIAHTAPAFSSYPTFAPAPIVTRTVRAAPAAEVHLAVPEQKHDHDNEVCLSLTYWGCRGLASSIRMLLTYADACFDETIITDPQEWFGPEGKKNTLREENPFINLPFFEDGALVLSQSNSILRHIGRKFNLIGCNVITAAKSDMLLDQLTDLRTKWSQLMYATKPEDFEAAKASYLAAVAPDFLGKFAEWLALNNTGFLVEDHPTVADFVLWELLDIHLALEPTVLDALPRLQEFHATIRSEPKLEKYFNSEAAALPINGAVAVWNA